MEQESQSPQEPKKKKLGAKEIISIILLATVAVLVKTATRALFSDRSSSSNDYQVEIDLDLPEREPIDFQAIIDESFQEAGLQIEEEPKEAL